MHGSKKCFERSASEQLADAAAYAPDRRCVLPFRPTIPLWNYSYVWHFGVEMFLSERKGKLFQ